MTSTEARQGFNEVITTADKEPVIISKRNKTVAVVLSDRRYKELKRFEDILYGKAAELAIQEGLAPKSEVEELFKDL